MHFTIYFWTDWAVLNNTLLIRNAFLTVKILTVREKKKKMWGLSNLVKILFCLSQGSLKNRKTGITK